MVDIYHFDADSKLFTGTSLGRVDPMDDKKLLMPAHSTLTPLPELGANQVAKWTGEEWQRLIAEPDHDFTEQGADRQPNWLGFRQSLLEDEVYLALAEAAENREAVRRLELAAATDSRSWGLVCQLWNAFFFSTPTAQRPARELLSRWNTLFSANQLPLTLAEDGTLNPASQGPIDHPTH